MPLLKEEPMGTQEEYDEAESLPIDRRKRRPLLRKENIGWLIFLACLLGLTIGVAAGVAVLLVWSWQPQMDSCFRQSSMPSAVELDVPMEYHTQQFNGSLMMENIYRQLGSPEVDAAWEALGVDCESTSLFSRYRLLTVRQIDH